MNSDGLFERIEKQMLDNAFPTESEKLDKEHKQQAIAYYTEQRNLIAEQSKYAKTIKRATFWMAVATCLMALMMILQYLFPIRETVIAPRIQSNQAPPPIETK